MKDEEFREAIVGIAEQIKDKKPKIQANWEQNPVIKETTERLGIFEKNS